MDDLGAINVNRPACSECQRRKQKCNREWPCNHCLKRKVADKCRFNYLDTSSTDRSSIEGKRKRQIQDTSSIDGVESPVPSTAAPLTLDEAQGFKELGYMPSHHLYKLAIEDGPNSDENSTESIVPSVQVPQLDRALQMLPPRPYTDLLVETFKDNVNFHYYIVYPPSFLDQYRSWWADRANKRPLDLSWTSLLLVVCACAAQYMDADTQAQFELDLGESAQTLTQRYHDAAKELGNAVPSTQRTFPYVQYLLHSCYWYKSEARFVECWHTLCDAVREAQELGLHKESITSQLPEFDREMRRRVWCLLDVWDWQISGLLHRPLIIDRADSDVELPSLALESDLPSPILHVKLQSQLIKLLVKKYLNTINLMATTPAKCKEYQEVVEAWRAEFPPRYRRENPDTSMDAEHPWIVLHRHYLQTISTLMILDPFKAYLAKVPPQDATPAWMSVRDTGVDYCLKIMLILKDFFTFLYPRDAKFHFVLFCIFDISTVLCSAIMHDPDHTLPRRDEMYDAIESASDMLQQLNSVTKSASTSNQVVQKLKARLPPRDGQVPSAEQIAKRPMATAYSKKRAKNAGALTATPTDLASSQTSSSESIPRLSSASGQTPALAPRASAAPNAAAPPTPGSTPSSAGPQSASVPDGNAHSSAGSTPLDNGLQNHHQQGPVPEISSSHNGGFLHPSGAQYHHPLEPNQGQGNVYNNQNGQNAVPYFVSQQSRYQPPAASHQTSDGQPEAGLYIAPATAAAAALGAPEADPDPAVMQQQVPDMGQAAETFQVIGLGEIQPADLGDFGNMWDWQALDLGYGQHALQQQQQQHPQGYDQRNHHQHQHHHRHHHHHHQEQQQEQPPPEFYPDQYPQMYSHAPSR